MKLAGHSWSSLNKMGANTAKDFALVLNTRMWERAKEYEEAGVPPPDARQEAEKEGLLLEPEADEVEETEEAQ